MMKAPSKLTIRERARRGRVREAGGEYQVWQEWQLVDGRQVIGRFDFEAQALKAKAGAELARAILERWRSRFPVNAYAWPGAPADFAAEASAVAIRMLFKE